MQIELIFVDKDGTIIQEFCQLPDKATVATAFVVSNFLEKHPNLKELKFGIFSQIATTETLLKNGDRIEFYRPLVFDPKEKRRQRAKAN